MRLGAHISTAGGAYRAFERARGACCDSFLIFTKSNRQWAAKPFSDDDITFYKNAVAEYADLHPVSVHAAYLINVASPDPALWEKSYLALKEEVERAAALGISLITFHPVSYTHLDVYKRQPLLPCSPAPLLPCIREVRRTSESASHRAWRYN